MKTILQKYKSLDEATRSLMFAFWIFEFGQAIFNVFLNIFIFLETRSFSFFIFYNAVLFISCFLGFSAIGYLIAQWKISIRYVFLASFTLSMASFFLLNIAAENHLLLFLFTFLNGLSRGSFWMCVHSFELSLTNNKTRDFYSSVVSAGSQAIKIIAPLFATFSFLIAKYFEVETFKVLFILLPIFTCLAIPFVLKMPNFTPSKIPFSQFKPFLFSPKNRHINQMYFFDSVEMITLLVLTPFIALFVLDSVTNIGIFETIMGGFSIVFTLFLSVKRNAKNRSQMLFHGFWGLVGTYCLLIGFDLGVYCYILFALGQLFFTPIWNISLHMIHLASIEKMVDQDNFFAGLLYREFMLLLGRLFSLVLLGIIFYVIPDSILAIKTALITMITLMIAKFHYSKKVDRLCCEKV